MKKLFKILRTIAILAVLLLSFAACDGLFGSLDKNDSPTDTYKPVVFTSYGKDGAKYELEITRSSRNALPFTPDTGDSYTLTITTAGAIQTSTGHITVDGTTFTLIHAGTGNTFSVTVSANSSSGGSIVSFTGDIPINNSATKVPAPGELSPNPTPVAGDYDIGNLTQSVGSVTAVTISPKLGKSSGARTIYYEGTSGTTYAKSKTLPTAKGTYAVTFDVAAASGWNAAAGLSAGNLEINTNQTPKADDYTYGNMEQTVGSVKAVTITANAGKSPGAVSNIKYAGSATLPTAKGTYAVTFDVAAATGWNAVTDLSAGNLAVVDPNLPKLQGVLWIDGFAQVGQTLTAAFYLGNESGTISYQWKRGTTIIGTNSNTYVVVSGDIGSTITVTVTCTGYSGSVTSDPTEAVTAAGTLTGWVWIETPHIQVGNTLAVGYNLIGSGAISYQWKRGTTSIGTDSTYLLTDADKGSKITVTVTRSGWSGSVTSDPEGPVTDNDFIYFVVGDEVTITGFNYNSDYWGYEVWVPQTLYGKPVTSIGASAFKNKGFSRVYISKNVTSIGDYAFDGNQLDEVGIGSDVELGTSAFPSGFVTVYEAWNKTSGFYNTSWGDWRKAAYDYDY